jgi:hypothetical protein
MGGLMEGDTYEMSTRRRTTRLSGGRQRLGYGLLIDGARDSPLALANNVQSRQRLLKVLTPAKKAAVLDGIGGP